MTVTNFKQFYSKFEMKIRTFFTRTEVRLDWLFGFSGRNKENSQKLFPSINISGEMLRQHFCRLTFQQRNFLWNFLIFWMKSERKHIYFRGFMNLFEFDLFHLEVDESTGRLFLLFIFFTNLLLIYIIFYIIYLFI